MLVTSWSGIFCRWQAPRGPRTGRAGARREPLGLASAPCGDPGVVAGNQHLGDRPLPRTPAAACNADARADRSRNFRPLPEASLPITPGSSRTTASSRTSAAGSPPDRMKSPIETSSRPAPSMTRWSTPSKRPQTITAPGPAARSRTRPASTASRAGSSAAAGGHRPRGAAWSIARASTSARMTMPAPPPAGVSSTLRCRSVAKSRICTVSSDQVPATSARPASDRPSGPGNISG